MDDEPWVVARNSPAHLAAVRDLTQSLVADAACTGGMRRCFGCRRRSRPSVVQPEGPYMHAEYNKMLTSRQHSVGVGLQIEVESLTTSFQYFNREPRIH